MRPLVKSPALQKENKKREETRELIKILSCTLFVEYLATQKTTWKSILKQGLNEKKMCVQLDTTPM
jgi:hypothetical protein